MSNDEYQHQTFCQTVKMKKRPKVKIDLTLYPGVLLGLGVHFPFTHYIDASIIILCFSINIKWRKR